MPSFIDSFWSPDYAGGLGVLFEKLHQGCVENEEILALAAARIEAEEFYGNKLKEIPDSLKPRKTGFGKDDGASLRKAYEGMVKEMGGEGQQHLQVTENIKRMVTIPFSKWSEQHSQRVDYSHQTLRNKLKIYERDGVEAQKAQKKYFNKCRMLENYIDENGTEDSDGNGNERVDVTQHQLPKSRSGSSPTKNASSNSSVERKTASQGIADFSKRASLLFSKASIPVMSSGSDTTTHEAASSENDPIQSSSPSSNATDAENPTARQVIELAGVYYEPSDVAVLLDHMLTEIPQKSVKVPILGTYDDVSAGDVIVEWIMANIPFANNDGMTHMAYSERFGQDLISNGFLRQIGTVSNKFANSSVLNYQWKKEAFIKAGHIINTGSNNNNGSSGDSGFGIPITGSSFASSTTDYLGETFQNFVVGNNSEETTRQRLQREVCDLDNKYKQSVIKLDDSRCDLEENIAEHVKFMERCERDRLKAIKAVFLDFLASISNNIPSIQASVDNLLLYQETINPANDLRYLLECYRTGPYLPKVTVYDNYYNATDDQTFGIDLELRSRGDRKKVPFVVAALLSHLDNIYPLLDNDDIRRQLWTVHVSLQMTHSLRRQINTGKPFPKSILEEYEPPIVASVLKLYFLELPDSLVPSQYYDIIKTIYTQHGSDADPSSRISAIQNTFAQFCISNIATLDALFTHLTRLISVVGATDDYLVSLSQEFALCVLRPREQSAITLSDNRSSYRLAHDLLTYKERIFSELKRQNSELRRTSRSFTGDHLPSVPGGGNGYNPTAELHIGSGSRTVSLSSNSASNPSAHTNNMRQASLQNRLEALNIQKGVNSKGHHYETNQKQGYQDHPAANHNAQIILPKRLQQPHIAVKEPLGSTPETAIVFDNEVEASVSADDAQKLSDTHRSEKRKSTDSVSDESRVGGGARHGQSLTSVSMDADTIEDGLKIVTEAEFDSQGSEGEDTNAEVDNDDDTNSIQEED
ncbi:hypothetical protein NADFUDRAFT_80294 [Nadsonia fulvescens var. elongata DSM 6958]|uniref:Rho-GAP domain-containing protein n=1 Tax=Nadsonia fulvescens var. elongata DSM 6958 TaxID=857566 RepID=A0A1E3PDI3_9ASCO|nr:hypothetical protein NADFUDRAFT_80294 [Nadsonia fulvescens var. elongata DSM 6958]